MITPLLLCEAITTIRIQPPVAINVVEYQCLGPPPSTFAANLVIAIFCAAEKVTDEVLAGKTILRSKSPLATSKWITKRLFEPIFERKPILNPYQCQRLGGYPEYQLL
jgi:hypothetical protein